MARSLSKTSKCQSFVCGQKVDDATMNTLSDTAASAYERGETVVNQTGTRQPDRGFPVLIGHPDGSSTFFANQEIGWEILNAGYTKWRMRLTFKLDSLAYSNGAGTGDGVTLIQVIHTDKNGATATLWDSTVAGATRGSQQQVTVSGTFANPPASNSEETEAIGLKVYTNYAGSTETAASWSGVLNFCFKLYGTC